MIKIQPEEYKAMVQYVYSLTGISLDNTKQYLVESRLGPLLNEFGLSTYSELFYKARSDSSKAMQRRMIDAITTGETQFFRDSSPFELLQHKILPDLIDKRKKSVPQGSATPIRIWSAACSTGQEVYSIAIVLKELLMDLNAYSIRLIGTDISDQAVAHASRGIYNSIEIERGLSKEKLARYFTPEGNTYKIRDEIRGLASFRSINLMEDFSAMGRFDIILCRNIAIYFNEADRTQLFNRLGRNLEPDGYLLIGSTESISGICPQFESKRYMRSVFYQFKA